MWPEDEDNNPYEGASSRPSSPISPSRYNRWSSGGDQADYTRQLGSDDGFGSHAEFNVVGNSSPIAAPQDEQFTSEDDAEFAASRILPKKGGYESRVEQFLYENPNIDILIPVAGKNPEGNGKYIVYTIRVGDIECRRRYSEFLSLRETMVNLHPTLIIPPIPEKHRMSDYVIKMTKAKEDSEIIELRKRMLAVFLNRCRQMREVREDGVWWKFLDPNASWNEIKNSPPISSIPKNILKAPPLDVANPTPAHNFLPTPAASSKLKSESSHDPSSSPPSTRFPLPSAKLSEESLDPYFISFEQSSRSLEKLLQGPMEKSNQTLLERYNSLSKDLSELGAGYNAFALSETSDSLIRAIEKIGQAVDRTCVNTKELSRLLNLSYAEPMRENAQFAGIVRNVLRYRILKRLQQEMTQEQLEKKRAYLLELEQSEAEAQRIEQYLSNSSLSSGLRTGDSAASSVGGSDSRSPAYEDRPNSVVSDFPPSHEPPASAPAISTTMPASLNINSNVPASAITPSAPSLARTGLLGRSLTTRFGQLNHTFRGIVDSDPERNRRDQITKTREAIANLEMALQVAATDVTDASEAVLKDLRRFQAQKEEDLKRYMIAFATDQIEWAKRSKAAWEEAKVVVTQIEATSSMTDA